MFDYPRLFAIIYLSGNATLSATNQRIDMQLVTLNGKQLKEISHKNRTAEVTMTALAMRERVRNFSDIPRTRAKLIKEGEKIVETDYLQLWKDLQTAGVGVIVYGSNKRPNRFQWHFSLKQVAEVCLEGTDQKADITAKPQAVKVIRRPALEVKAASPVAPLPDRLVYVSLRKDFDVAIKLPGNVTQDEIATISKALNRIAS